MGNDRVGVYADEQDLAENQRKPGILRRAVDVDRFLEAGLREYAAWLAGLLIAVFFLVRARALELRHVWSDELVSYYLARTFSWTRICEALGLAVDAQPPTYHLLQIPVLAVLGDRPQSLRWLTLLAASATLAVAFVWLRRTTSPAAALAGVCLLATSKLHYYAIEARPYALLMATTALALASRGLPWRVAWLGLGVSLHYYAFLVPCLLAFTEPTWRRRLAYGFALAPLAVTVPAMHPLHNLAAGEAFVPTFLNLLMTLPIMTGVSRYALLALGLAAVVVWFSGRWRRSPGDLRAAWLLFAMIPLCWLLSRALDATYFYRYALVSLLGVSGLAAAAIDRLPYRALAASAAAGLCLGAVVLSPRGFDIWDARPTARLLDGHLAASSVPVVMGANPFLDLHFYLSPEHRKSFYRLTPERHSFTREYVRLAHRQDPWGEMVGLYAGFKPVGMADWLTQHRSFRVLAVGANDWVLEACRRSGARVVAGERVGSFQLYSVEVGR